MLVELEIELGRFAQAAERVAALRGASEAALPLELDIKEGVCHAYLGELKRAEALWKPLRLHPQRLNLYADLLYEVGLTYHTLDRLREAHAVYRELAKLSRYANTANARDGECLLALQRTEEAAAAFAISFSRDAATCRRRSR